MQNPRLAGRYAKSLVDLAGEKDQLNKVYDDMKYLQAVNKQSKEFVAMLKSPVIHADKKNAVISGIIGGKVSELSSAFLTLLVQKNRESALPEIVDAFIDQYNDIKGIHKVKLTTAAPVSEELQKSIVSKVKQEAGFEHVELESKVDESIIGGFVLEYHNKLMDASIARELNDIKKGFQNNEFIQNIR